MYFACSSLKAITQKKKKKNATSAAEPAAIAAPESGIDIPEQHAEEIQHPYRESQQTNTAGLNAKTHSISCSYFLTHLHTHTHSSPQSNQCSRAKDEQEKKSIFNDCSLQKAPQVARINTEQCGTLKPLLKSHSAHRAFR